MQAVKGIKQKRKEFVKMTGKLENKKEEVVLLTQAVKDAKEQADFKEVFLGLDELLSRTITMDKKNLIEAFKIAKTEVGSLIETIADRHNQDVSIENINTTDIDISDLEDETFDVIDQIKVPK